MALSQRVHLGSLLYSLYKGPDLLHLNADKVFIKYSSQIKKRIDFLIQFFGEDNVFFYSSYPITPSKLKMLSQFNISFRSSFPDKKTKEDLLKSHNKKVTLVIGDRNVDKKLARDLESEWRGYPYYSYHQLLSGNFIPIPLYL